MKRVIISICLICCACNVIWAATGTETGKGYYDGVIGLSGAALKTGLHNLLRTTHTTEFGYANLETQLKITDEDPNNANNVIEIYTGWSVPKNNYGGETTDWNKEHTWSKSHGDFGDIAPAGTDLHHLRPCDATVNSFKNNRDFDEGANAYTDASPPSGYSGTTNCSYDDANDFEPRDADKGDVARVIFYMAVRYEGTDTAYDLELVDYTYSDEGTNLPYYGKLSTLLAWHVQDPPDAWEALRNDRIQGLQGNRNPFIDHPEWVASIWSAGTASTYVQFSPNSATVNEADGSVNLTVVITDPSPFAATTADIVLSSGSLASGSCAVFQHSSAVLTLPAGVTATNNGAVNFNGDDAIVLFNTVNSSNVDIFGRMGEDPGTAWGTDPLITVDKTLRRKASILSGVTANPTSGFPTLATDWESYSTNTVDGLGSHALSGGISYLAGYQDLSVSPILARVSGLNPNTAYSYVVRAVHAGGTTTDSNPIEVLTTAVIAGTGANTSIEGASTTVLVPTLRGFANNDLQLDPLSTTNDDYSVSANTISGGISFSISSSNNDALNGTYILHHEGLGYAPQGVQYSFGGSSYQASSFVSTALQTELVISGLSKYAKGSLNIELLQEPTLPVELSSFTAAITPHNFVALQWVSQSETGMLGYYVLRAPLDDLAQALVISPLVIATNTSQTQVYLFEDSELSEDGRYYYWLQNLDMNGATGFYGPISIVYTGNFGANPTPPLITAFVSSYPNPFSDRLQLRYSLAKDAQVSFSIFNLRGQKVAELPAAGSSKGFHSLVWDGRDQHGRSCANGLYYIRMQVGPESSTRKVMILK